MFVCVKLTDIIKKCKSMNWILFGISWILIVLVFVCMGRIKRLSDDLHWWREEAINLLNDKHARADSRK